MKAEMMAGKTDSPSVAATIMRPEMREVTGKCSSRNEKTQAKMEEVPIPISPVPIQSRSSLRFPKGKRIPFADHRQGSPDVDLIPHPLDVEDG